MKYLAFSFLFFWFLIPKESLCSFPTDNISVDPFPKEHEHLNNFREMCNEIGKVVNSISKDINKDFGCFISYAWPNKNSNLREWIDKIFEFLTLAGLKVFYDVNERSFTGSIFDIEQKLKDNPVLFLLTPDYEFKCEKGDMYALSREAQKGFEKFSCDQYFVLLAGNVESSLPKKYSQSRFTLGAKIVHMMTGSKYNQQKRDDSPKIDSFYICMLNLLNPYLEWGLFFHLPSREKEKCSNLIEAFKKCILRTDFESLFFPIGNRIFKRITNVSNTLQIGRMRIPICFERRKNENGECYFSIIKKSLDSADKNGVVISGTGGSGKTIMANQYAIMNNDFYDIVWKFSCDKFDHYKISVLELYKQMFESKDVSCIDIDTMKEEIRFKIKKDSLKVLFFYDNVTDSKFFGENLLFDENIHFIATSRQKILEFNSMQIFLSSFSKEEAKNCFQRIAERTFSEKNKDNIIEDILLTLEFLPLAVCQAGYYLKSETRKNLNDYLNLLKNKPLETLDLVSTVPLSVIKSFEISCDSLSDDAKNLLFIAGFLYYDSIPVLLLDLFRGENVTKELERFGFLRMTGFGDFMHGSLHRLYGSIIIHIESSDYSTLNFNKFDKYIYSALTDILLAIAQDDSLFEKYEYLDVFSFTFKKLENS
ncbi:MAG: hypothetical protein HEEMFOPI_01562 [Holosporales bacterium]